MTLATAGPRGLAEPAPSVSTVERSRRVALDLLPAALVFVGVIVAWEVIVGALELKAFILPQPSAIVAALGANWPAGGRFALSTSAGATLIEAAGGLAIGTAVGVGVALVSARWATARGVLLPLAVAAGAVPIIAFAPLFNNWFGVLNPLSKAMMAAVLVFFPMMANVIRGLIQVPPAALELMRSYAASDWTILRLVRIPNALPYFFTALRLGATLSLIGAVVGEYFGGASFVLGRIVVQSASALRYDVTWAAILLMAGTGIVLYAAISFIERLAIPWYATNRGGGRG
ncbi:MAG: transporter permease [Chloroflexi bacterium]|nr:transporter permease [Chloroflexota bacterium]